MKVCKTIKDLKDQHAGKNKRSVDVSPAEFMRFFDQKQARGRPQFPCHFGQKKLFYALFDFLTTCSEKFNMKDCLLIYIGASPGYNIPLVLEYFPDLKADLYDPLKIQVKSSENISVFSGNQGYVKDAACEVMKTRLQNLGMRHLLLFSDVRGKSNDNDIIASSMRAQDRWARLLAASAISLKFRPMYDVFQFRYLSGELRLQINAPARSVECRLIAFPMSDGTFNRDIYDVDELDRIFHSYNQKVRGSLIDDVDCRLIKKTGIGLMGDHDTALEINIIKKYLSSQRLNNSSSTMIDLIREINQKLCETTGFALQRCSSETLRKFRVKHGLAAGVKVDKNDEHRKHSSKSSVSKKIHRRKRSTRFKTRK